MKIDFTTDFVFIANDEDGYYVKGHPVELESDYTEWSDETDLCDGYGFFIGLAIVSRDKPPTRKGDTDYQKLLLLASFSEFDIYYKDILLPVDMTYSELKTLILQNSRNDKLNQIL